MPDFILTFDIDWAPDFAIEFCLDVLRAASVKATFFATHKTEMNQEIERQGHILGIHPNFLENSSHGSSVPEVITHCLNFAPNAWSVRTHALVQSSPLLYNIFSQFPQLTMDASLFLHRSPYAHKLYWESEGLSFSRVLYNWEDDAEFHMQRFGAPNKLFFGDLTILDFHPIHVFLNSSDGNEYQSLKKSLCGAPLQHVEKKETEKFVNLGRGVLTHLTDILASNANCRGLEDL